MTDAVRPFELRVPQEALADLRDRLERARWPEAETTAGDGGPADWSQGPPLDYIRTLADEWKAYDWRQVENRINAHGHGRARIDGLDIHFLHTRSPRTDARPLVVTHGWPGSVLEPLEVMDALANPPDPGLPAFHVVAVSLPGYGFGGKPAAPGWNVDRTADAWAELMGRLGYDRFFAAGGDWGGRVTASLGRRHPDRVAGVHSFTPYVPDPPEGFGSLSDRERQWVAGVREFRRSGSGYSLQQSTRPQTLGYALADSPVGQLAWLLDKFHAWTDNDGDPADAIPREKMLDMVSWYWLSNTAASSARFYWENFPPDNSGKVEVPAAVTVFPADIEKIPQPWVENRFTDLRSYRVAERGGHFPMLEVPELYVDELRRGLGPMPG